jgi:uncharacterized protein
MKRLIDWHLQKWKDDKYRKPLIIRGARQVGKTYAVRNLGKSFENIVEVNFELKKEKLKDLFKEDLQPDRILQALSTYYEQPIIPGKTLLFFDEIQETPEAIQALRYFYELQPDLHVVAAGSLLDFALEKVGMPVGRVSSLYLYPLSFIEFLIATNHSSLIKVIIENESKHAMPEIVHSKLLSLVAEYIAIGGMPEALARWLETKDPRHTFAVYSELADTYRQDFLKYATKYQIKYLDSLFNQIPQLVGEQFKYHAIHGEYKKRELAPCLDLLCLANVVHKVHHTSGNGLPLGAESNMDWFKIILLDIAFCQSILGLKPSPWFLEQKATFVNRGAITEAFVGQELLCYSQPSKKTDLYFWRASEKSRQAEVDYLYDYNGLVLPIEVKSKDGRTLKSMHSFLEQHKNSTYGIRFSTQNYSVFEKVHSRPLYAVATLAHEDQLEGMIALMQMN